QDVLHRAVFVDVPGHAQRRQILDLVGAGDGAAEDQNGELTVVELADGSDQFDAWCVRQPEVEHDQIDGDEIGAHAGQELRRALDGDRLVPGGLERRAKPVADKRRVVGDDDGLGGDRGTGHLKCYRRTTL